MPQIIDRDHMQPALAALLGSCDVDGGPSDSQLALVGALASVYFPDPPDLSSIVPLSPDEASAQFQDEAQRHRLFQFMVVAEMCRHPLGEAQVDRTEAYAAAFGITDEALVMARSLVTGGNAMAEADFMRSFDERRELYEEPVLAHHGDGGPGAVPPEVFEQVQALRNCPEGSLGRTYVQFYDDNGFELPSVEDPYAGVFMAHDMSHVIAGYGPSGLEEIALGAMQIGMVDTEAHWVQFLGNLGVHEARFVHHTDAPPVLSAPGALEVVAHAFQRGAATPLDFSVADHLSMADLPLEEVRAHFGVAPREL